MKVIIDSNIIIADFRLKTPDWTLLLQSSLKLNIELLIPQLVLDEVMNKYEERLKQSENTIKKEISILDKLTEKSVENPITKAIISTEIKKYNDFLLKTFKENKACILPYPEPSHKFLANKAIKKKKPFNDNEKGYRDCLLWESVKENLPELGTNAGNPEVVFITKNKSDFLDANLSLHNDLVEELEDNSYDVEALKIYIELNDFNSEINSLFFLQAKSFKKKLENSNFEEFELKKEIYDYLESELINKELSDEIELPHYYQDPTVQFIDKVEILKIKEVRKLSADNYIVELIVNAEIQLDFFVDKYEHYSRDEIYYDVQDSDWNEYVIWACEIMEMPFEMTIIINSKLELESAQIN